MFTAAINPAVDPTGAIAELNGFFATANSNGQATDTINLFPNSKYVFNFATDKFDGGTALPVIDVVDNTITVNGNNATFFRPAGAESFRFLRADGTTGDHNHAAQRSSPGTPRRHRSGRGSRRVVLSSQAFDLGWQNGPFRAGNPRFPT